MKTVSLPLGPDGRPDAQTAAWYIAYVCYPENEARCTPLVNSALVWVCGGKTQPEFKTVQPARLPVTLGKATRVMYRERFPATWVAYQRIAGVPRDKAIEQVTAVPPLIKDTESFRRRTWLSSVPALAMAAPLYELALVNKRQPADLLSEPDWVTRAVETAQHEAPILKQRLKLERALLVPELIQPTKLEIVGEDAIRRYLASARLVAAWPRSPTE